MSWPIKIRRLLAPTAVAGTIIAIALSQTKATTPKPQDRLAIGEEQAKE